MAKRKVITSNRVGWFFFSASIPVDPLSERAVRGSVLRALQLIGDSAQKDFKKTVTHWRDKPTFEKPVIRYAKGNPRIQIVTVSDKWKWLNYGTKVRWAIMHKDFRPKTTPGRFVSGKGSPPYDPVWRGYSMGAPQPGIEPRGWTEMAKRKYRPIARKALREALSRAVRTGRP